MAARREWGGRRRLGEDVLDSGPDIERQPGREDGVEVGGARGRRGRKLGGWGGQAQAQSKR